MTYRFGNAQHIGARQQQQDSFGFSDPGDEAFAAHGGFLAVVADGMGGLAHGDAASRTAVRSFLQAYRAKTGAESVPQALERAMLTANLDVNTLASTLGQSGEMGTTLVAAVLRGEELYWASCGDSAVFLLRDGESTLLNTQHVYARILDERAARGEISNEEALGDPQRESLTSHLGQPQMEELDLSTHPFPLRAGDTLLLASDGLFKTVPESDIAALVGSGADVQGACERLVAMVLSRQRRGQDNVTVVAIGCGEPAAEALPVTVASPAAGAQPMEAANGAKRDRAKESLAAQESAARGIVESRLSAAPPPPRAKRWKIVVPALLFVALVVAAGLYAWRRSCCSAPVEPAGAQDRAAGATGFDTNKLPPSKPGSEGTVQPPAEFEPLQPETVEPKAGPGGAKGPPARK